jgi:hypothetical protein
VFAGGQRFNANFGVAVRMGGDVDGVDVGGEKMFKSGRSLGDGELATEGRGAFWVSAPDGVDRCVGHGCNSFGEAGGGATGTDDAKANKLWGFVRRRRVHAEIGYRPDRLLRLLIRFRFRERYFVAEGVEEIQLVGSPECLRDAWTPVGIVLCA